MEHNTLCSKTYIVKRQEEGFRLDNFLFERLDVDMPGEFSRGALILGIRSGQVAQNGKKTLKPSQKVHMNDDIACELSFPEKKKKGFSSGTFPEPRVLFEDENVVFVDKPAGLMTHPAHIVDQSLIDWISLCYPQIIQVGDNPLRPGIVHRLDKDTSGVLVIAKTPAAFTELKRLFQTRNIEKTYYALTEGYFLESSGKIDFPITRIPHSEKRSVRRANDDQEARAALTFFEVLKHCSGYDVVRVSPKTGRTHQIRVHFSALQHPIVGDRLYGFRRKKSSVQASRQMLHAGRLAFTLFEKSYTVESPPPEDFQKLSGGLTESH